MLGVGRAVGAQARSTGEQADARGARAQALGSRGGRRARQKVCAVEARQASGAPVVGARQARGVRGLDAGRAAFARGLARAVHLVHLACFWPGSTRYFS